MSDTDSRQPRVTKLRLEGVGPLTRSTVGTGPVDPQAEAINDALHWIWSWRVQVRRLRESFEAEWAGGTVLEHRTALENRQVSSRFSFDEHMLVVTGWNLARAIKRVEATVLTFGVRDDQREALKLLRHLYEHWDEQRPAFQSSDVPKEKSAAALAAHFPQGRPWTIVFDKTDWLLGGVVRINELTRALKNVESTLLAIEAKPHRAE